MGVLLLKDPHWQKDVHWEKRLGLPRGALFRRFLRLKRIKPPF
jgi:hypothetical protein